MHQNPNSHRHIFLADDDCDDRQMFEDALLEVDRNVILTHAEDGVELMNILSLKPDPFPELIFLDLNMPKRNGLDCLMDIRRCIMPKPHVIMLTTSENPMNIQSAFELGASFYAVKPNTFEGLKSLISIALSIDWSKYSRPSNKRDFILS